LRPSCEPGYVPLVALLDNRPYIRALHNQTQHILAQAAAQAGWLGPLFERSTPLTTARGKNDFWQSYRMLGALCQYAELAPARSEDTAAVTAGLLEFVKELVRKRRLCAITYRSNNQPKIFAKTGSGQTRAEVVLKRRVFSVGWVPHRTPDRDWCVRKNGLFF
jgi:hypothetical protein